MVEILDTPDKSPADRKEYRAIKLKNGLVALLISDLYGAEDGDDNAMSDGDNAMSDGDDGEEGDSGEEEEGEDEPEKIKKISAAAMAVKAGSFHEPSDCGGLAHFCEHMIFMGSKKYPEENMFDSLVSRNSGSDNAYTDADVTVYEFDVAPEKFNEALDIWAQFFIDPLMKEDAVDREVTAVNSEFEMSKVSDYARRFQIMQEALMKKDHPQVLYLF